MAEPALPLCPRCGYDQAGAVAAWGRTDPAACPLDGLCTECGLEFWWRDLLNPVYAVQHRFFEHARRNLTGSLLLTVWRALRPRAFWRWVRMEHTIVPRRLVAGVAAGALLTYLGSAAALLLLFVVSAWVKRMVGTVWWSPMPSEIEALRMALWPIGGDLYSGWYFGRPPRVLTWGVVSMVAVVGMPAVFLVLPDTLRQARVRKTHLVRIALYSLIGLPVVAAAGTAAHLVITMLRLAAGATRFDGGVLAWLDRAIMGHGRLSVLAFVCVWLAVWWVRAARLYLRLPQPRLAVAAVLAVATLAAVVVGFFVPGLGTAVMVGW